MFKTCRKDGIPELRPRKRMDWTEREEGQKGIRNESKNNELAEFWFSTEKPKKMKANTITAQLNQKWTKP